jgi:hypothetical protein
MADIGMDQWFFRMEEHKRRGDRIRNDVMLNDMINEMAHEENVKGITKDFFLKDQIVKNWEQKPLIPAINRLGLWKLEAGA